MRETDESLLLSFATHGDEAAFRQLAERHMGLIYHTALRRTGNRQLAEEVSQNILCALARKAGSLAKNTHALPAWLHRATVFESSKAMRSEISRQRRTVPEPEVATTTSAEPPASTWAEALPHLDSVLDKLSDPERAIILQHYFEDRPFPAIAKTLGKNTAAIQKQAQRALAKLARFLRSRGVVLPVAVIASGLATEFCRAAPPAFLKSTTTAVLSGSIQFSTTGITLMTLSKSNALVPVLILVLALPLGLQQAAISRVRSGNEQLRSQLASQDSGTDLVASRPRGERPGGRGSGISTSIDIHVLLDEQRESARAGEPDAFNRKLNGLSNEILIRLVGEGAALRVNRDDKEKLLNSLLEILAGRDSPLAVATALDSFGTGRAGLQQMVRVDVGRHFATWAKQDLTAARAWLDELEKSGAFQSSGTPAFSSAVPLLSELRSALLSAMVHGKSPDSAAYLASFPKEERAYLLNSSMSGKITRRGKVQSNGDLSGYLPLIREQVPEKDRAAALANLVGSLRWSGPSDDLSDVSALFTAGRPTAEEREAIARAAVKQVLNVHRMPPDPARDARILADTRDWLRRELPASADEIFQEAAENALQNQIRRADDTLNKLRGQPDLPDAQLAETLTRENLTGRLEEAIELAGKIKDPARRAEVIRNLCNRQATSTPANPSKK